VDGTKVVDLWGSAQGDPSFTPDLPATVFSTTKVITSIVMSTLVDRGLIDYGEKVAT